MRRETTIREGTTDFIDFQLFSGHVPVNLTGNNHVDLILINALGELTVFSTEDSKLIITDQVDGKVQLRPEPGDFYFMKTPYKGYFWVYYSPTKKGAFPEDTWITINVSRSYPFANFAPLHISAILQ